MNPKVTLLLAILLSTAGTPVFSQRGINSRVKKENKSRQNNNEPRGDQKPRSSRLISGAIIDSKTKEPLEGATISIPNTGTGTYSGADGKFELLLPAQIADQFQLQIQYLGYTTQEVSVDLAKKKEVNLGLLNILPEDIHFQEVAIVASLVTDRATPQAISTIDVSVKEERLGGQELPMLLKFTPSAYASVSGGGFGDSRMSIRGFQQEEVGVLINGIPVNDMTNGRVYWSNWAGVGDMMRVIQVQRGLGASKLSINSIGGTVNIITNTASLEKKAAVTMETSNIFGYKLGFGVSTGQTKNGWAFSLNGSRVSGNGYVDNLDLSAWTYGMTVSKQAGNHIFFLSALGAPQWHYQRLNKQPIAMYDTSSLDKNHFNPDWGYLNGEKKALYKNYYHKPMISLNHKWNINERSYLSTVLYASYGRGAGSGFRRGFASTTLSNNAEGNQLNWDAVYNSNRSRLDTITDRNGNVRTGYLANGILRDSHNQHDWYGLISTFETQLSSKLHLLVGVDGRIFKGKNFRRVSDLLGADFYLETNYAGDDTLLINTGSGNVTRKGRLVGMDEKVEYDYKLDIQWAGLFSQLEYRGDRLTAYISANTSITAMQRQELMKNSEPSANLQFPGMILKGGLAYRVNEAHSFSLNSGYFIRAPFSRYVFVDEKLSNDQVQNAVSEKILTNEIGYAFSSHWLRLDITGYASQWRDKGVRISYNNAEGVRSYANITGMNALHLGVESSFIAKIKGDKVIINGGASIGNWKWTKDVNGIIFNELTQEKTELKLYLENLAIGDAPQTTLFLGARVEPIKNLFFAADFTYYDRLYAAFDPERRTNPDDRSQSWKLPDFSLIDIHAGYSRRFKFVNASLKGHINNLFNHQYVNEALDGATHGRDSALVFYGFGRTYSIGLTLEFIAPQK